MAAAIEATIWKFHYLRILQHKKVSMTMPSTTLSHAAFSSSSSSSFLMQPANIQISSASWDRANRQELLSLRVCSFSSSGQPPSLPRPPNPFPQAGPPSTSSSGSSNPRLQRPPSLSRRVSPRLRNHAVSLYHGDYEDYDGEPPDPRRSTWEYEGDRTSHDDDDMFGVNDESDDDNDEYDDDEDGEHADWSNEDDETTIAEMWAIRSEQIKDKLEKAKRLKWIENAKPKVFVSQIDGRGRSYGRGGRKTAHARVWIQPGLGNIVINRKDFVEYFTRDSDREMILMPFVVTKTAGQFDVQAYVAGGGLTGQAGAVRHGVARALQNFNPDLYRPILKAFKYLTRDPRQVERKKVGLKKARKARQWNRR